MAGLAKEFEQLGCWELATEEENIVIYGMDFEDEKVLLSLRMIWEKPLSMQKLLLLPPAIAKMIVFTGAKNWKTSLPGNICATNTNPAHLHCCMLWKSMNYLKIKINK